MNITVITPITTGKYRDDTMIFCEGFEKLGHNVYRVTLVVDGDKIVGEQPDLERIKNSDVVWAPFEPLAPVATYFKNKYGIPAVSHFEVIPPGRLSLDTIDKYWFNNVNPIEDKYYKEYKMYVDQYLESDGKTITCETHKRGLERFIGYKLRDIPIRPYALDNETIYKYLTRRDVKNQIFSSLRLVDHKRIHHVITALSLLETPPKYVIVGDGPERQKLEKLAKELKVDVDFKGICSDEDKYKLLQESMFCIYPWAWLPVCEAAYCNKPSIAYDSSDTRERLGRVPNYVQNNSIARLAEAIQNLIDNTELTIKLGIDAFENMYKYDCCTYNQLTACKIMLDIFEKVKK